MQALTAVSRMTHEVATASHDLVADIRTILVRGAGLLGLPKGAWLTHPAGLVVERRDLWVTLADVIRIGSAGLDADWRDEAEFTPVRSGQWESVLVSLIIERDWATIRRMARDLREQFAGEPEPMPPEPAWRQRVREVIDILSATRDTFRSRQIQHARELLERLLEPSPGRAPDSRGG